MFGRKKATHTAIEYQHLISGVVRITTRETNILYFAKSWEGPTPMEISAIWRGEQVFHSISNNLVSCSGVVINLRNAIEIPRIH